jgi:hypothetical protein
MNSGVKTRDEVVMVMHRLGLDGRIGEAVVRLPEMVDLQRDAALLADLGLDFDTIVSDLGGSAW